MRDMIISHPFSGEDDLYLLKDFVTSVMANDMQHSYWHVGDLLWGIYKDTVFDSRQSIRLWENEQGELLSFTWINAHEVVLQVSPRFRGSHLNDLPLEEMLAWGEERQGKSLEERGTESVPSFCAFEDDFPLIDMFRRHAYERDEFHTLHMSRDLNQPIPEAVLPEGWTIRHVGGEDEFDERVALHREVWQRSKVTFEAYRRMRRVAGYTPELDLVAVAPGGTFASYCICWLDPVNKIGEFEPVGTHSAYRGKGLGKAVMLEGLRRLQAFGMQTAIVCSLGSNEASKKLYASVGFRTYNKSYNYTRPL